MNADRGNCHVCDEKIAMMPLGSDRDAYRLLCPNCTPRLAVVAGLTIEIFELAGKARDFLREAEHVVVQGNVGRSQHTQEIHAQALEVSRINLERIDRLCVAALAALRARTRVDA